MSSPPEPFRCPLCGGDNQCGIARGESTCWCFTVTIPAEVLDRVPLELRDKACVCPACGAPRAATEAEPAAR